MRKIGRGQIGSLRHLYEFVYILQIASGQRREDRVGRQTVFNITERKRFFHAAEHVAEVINVRSVREHIGNFEQLAGFRVGISRHDHAKLAAAQIVGPTFPQPHPFDTAGAVTEGNKFLQEFGMSMLNIVEIQHDVVAHRQRQVQFMQLLPGGRVRSLLRVQGQNIVSQRRAVDAHEDQPQAMGDVFHQGGFAVTGR